MSQVCVIFPLFALISIQLVYGFPGDNVMLMPPLEMRNVDPYPTHRTHPSPPFQFRGNINNPHQIVNPDVMHRRQPQVPEMEKSSNQNMTFDEFMEILNEVSHQSPNMEEELLRHRAAVSTGRDNNQAYPTLPRPMGGYSRPNYGPPATYHEATAPASHTQPSSAQPKISLLKPDLSSLMAPLTTKVSSKFGGLMSLIFSLLSSSSSSGSQFSGLKDILIEGIIKPVFAAKGGLKALISKLTIPLIALLLINVEVLITIWWLWEECPVYSPEPAPYSPTYSKTSSKPTYNNSYNSNYNSFT